jgi:hypothetical protein
MTLRWSAAAVLALIVSCRTHNEATRDLDSLTVSFTIEQVESETLNSFRITDHWKVDINEDHCRLVQESVGRYRDTISIYNAKPCAYSVIAGDPERLCFTGQVLRGEQGAVVLDGCVARKPQTAFDTVEQLSAEEFCAEKADSSPKAKKFCSELPKHP